MGCDIALLKLSKPVDIPVPVVAAKNFPNYGGFKVFGARVTDTLEVAKFKIVPNEICMHLKNLHSTTFCAYSRGVDMDPGELMSFRMILYSFIMHLQNIFNCFFRC